ncbi:MAG: hypothetical protein WAK33_22450, partial [Silvibacterium sp.]
LLPRHVCCANQTLSRMLRCTLDFRNGSNASVELSWHVGFTADFGRMVATQELTLRARNRT